MGRESRIVAEKIELDSQVLKDTGFRARLRYHSLPSIFQSGLSRGRGSV